MCVSMCVYIGDIYIYSLFSNLLQTVTTILLLITSNYIPRKNGITN